MTVKKNNMEIFYGNRNVIKWLINDQCNFQCNYCNKLNYNKQNLNPIDTIKLAESLDYLKGDWQFDVSGGEPFLEKNFVDISRELTKKHYMGLLTNLSSSSVFDFADHIDPVKCLFVNASVHITEREKRDIHLNHFIKKMLYLQKKGFNVVAIYVAHPSLFSRIKNDISFLKSNGVQKVSIRIFFGMFDGNYYPVSYNIEQIKFLESMEADYPEFEILNRSNNHYGQFCHTGQRSFVMDREGNLYRCLSVAENYGNLFEKSIDFDFQTKPCPVTVCCCPFEGIVFCDIAKENVSSKLRKLFVRNSMYS